MTYFSLSWHVALLDLLPSTVERLRRGDVFVKVERDVAPGREIIGAPNHAPKIIAVGRRRSAVKIVLGDGVDYDERRNGKGGHDADPRRSIAECSSGRRCVVLKVLRLGPMDVILLTHSDCLLSGVQPPVVKKRAGSSGARLSVLGRFGQYRRRFFPPRLYHLCICRPGRHQCHTSVIPRLGYFGSRAGRPGNRRVRLSARAPPGCRKSRTPASRRNDKKSATIRRLGGGAMLAVVLVSLLTFRRSASASSPLPRS